MLPPKLLLEFNFQVYFVFKSDDSVVFSFCLVQMRVLYFFLLCPDCDLGNTFLGAN